MPEELSYRRDGRQDSEPEEMQGRVTMGDKEGVFPLHLQPMPKGLPEPKRN